MKERLKYGLIVFWVCSLYFFSSVSAADNFTVYSEYFSSSATRLRTWNVSISSSDEGDVNLKIFPEGSSKAICEINKLSSGEISFSSPVRTMSGSGGLLIVPSFPAPCDILPVDSQKDEEDSYYRNRSDAGGRTFEKRYTITSEDIEEDIALQNGWLKSALSDPAELRLITARDEQGNAVLKQLWAKDGKWWLYEETASRRSWRIQ